MENKTLLLKYGAFPVVRSFIKHRHHIFARDPIALSCLRWDEMSACFYDLSEKGLLRLSIVRLPISMAATHVGGSC